MRGFARPGSSLTASVPAILWFLTVPDSVSPCCTDKTHTIKSEAVKALDKEYSGLISEFVELNDFAGKPVRSQNSIQLSTAP